LPSVTIETIDVQMKFEHQFPHQGRFDFAGWVGKMIEFWGAEDKCIHCTINVARSGT